MSLSSVGSAVGGVVQSALGMTSEGHDAFELRAGPFVAGEFRVLSFSAREGISELFRIEAVVVTKLPYLVVEPLILGQPALLVMYVPGHPLRELQGIVRSVRFIGSQEVDELLRYEVTIVPRMWLLKKRTRSRVFQKKTAREIVETILGEHRVKYGWEARRAHKARDYCVQYQESDYDFVKRLLAEEGVYFYFAHPNGVVEQLTGGMAGTVELLASATAGVLDTAADYLGALGDDAPELVGVLARIGLSETVVFAEEAEYPGIGCGVMATVGLEAGLRSASGLSGAIGATLGTSYPVLSYNSSEGFGTRDEHVRRFEAVRAIKTKSVALRDYDYHKPLFNPTMSALTRTLELKGALSGSLVASMAGVASSRFSASGRVDHSAIGYAAKFYEQYDHLGMDPPDPSPQRARRMLEAMRRDASRCLGESTCRRLSAGHAFELSDHIVGALNGSYVVTRVVHKGRIPEASQHEEMGAVYENTFDCVPATVAYRPRSKKRSPRQVLEMAQVTGPAGEDIYVNELGEIKVQFAWDREGKFDEFSSIWVRVGQTWAGSNWGFQFIPRVGMEVAVLFAMGDVDRPMVIGAAPNPANSPPFVLPKHKTKSGIRTRSTPHGGEANENVLAFEDTLGQEEVYLHAERNLYVEVEQDHVHDVGYDGRGTKKAGNHSVRVADDQTTLVGRDQETRVERHRSAFVLGDHFEKIDGKRTRIVGGSNHDTTEGSRYDHIRQSHFVNVEGDRHLRVHGSLDEHVHGSVQSTITEAYRLSGYSDVAVMAGQNFGLNATDSALLEAGVGFRIVCGQSAIELTPEGIVLEGDSVIIKGRMSRMEAKEVSFTVEEGQAKLQAKARVDIQGDESVDVFSKNAHVGLAASGEKVAVTGKTVELQGQDSRVKLTSKAVVEGSEVHLNPQEGAVDVVTSGATPEALKTSWIGIKLVDQDGEPVSGARFVVTMSNQDKVMGVLDRMGKARLPVVPGQCKVSFPDYDGKGWGK